MGEGNQKDRKRYAGNKGRANGSLKKRNPTSTGIKDTAEIASASTPLWKREERFT